jgi:hypothetical protein
MLNLRWRKLFPDEAQCDNRFGEWNSYPTALLR